MSEKKCPVLHPLLELTLGRVLEFVRDPDTLFWVFAFPVILAVALGIAFRNQPEGKVRLAVIGTRAELIAERLSKVRGLEILPAGEAEAERMVRSGKIELVVRVAEWEGGVPSVVYRYDPTRPAARSGKAAVDDALQRAWGRADVLEIVEEKVTEKGGRYIDFLVPGLIGLNIMGSCMWGLGYVIVDWRKRRLLKRFAATPMHRSHFLIAFMFSRLIFLAAEVTALVVFGWVFFEVPIRGSLAALAAVSIVGMFSFSGLAFLIASRTAATEVSAGLMNLVQLPMWVLSGSFFDYNRFPEMAQPFIRLLPLTALNDSMRAIMTDGSGILGSWSQLAVMAGWGFLSFLLALRIFRWQ